MNSHYQCFVSNDFSFMAKRIYLIHWINNNEAYLLKSSGDSIPIKQYEAIPQDGFFFQVDGRQSEEILKAIIEGLNEVGFKNPSVSFQEGELKATKQHLEDMRRLVFEDGNKA